MSARISRLVKALTAQVRKILEAEFPDAPKSKRVVKDGKPRLVKASAEPALAVAPKTGKSAPQQAAARLRERVLAVLGRSRKPQACSGLADRLSADQRKVAAALKALCAAGEARMIGARSGARYLRVYPKG